MTFLIILLIVVCVALALFILIQNPKGGGLATGAGSSNMFGVQRTGDVLEKGSWFLLALIVVLSLAVTTIAKTSGTAGSVDSELQEQVDKLPNPSPIGGGTGTGTATPPPPAASKDTTKK
ncbi:preprotein translocase subunit SecG [Pedobacter yulinensis]|uniref:Protein-export membrane protein SecG n=1 Tax=Pedobacter yulinensis TaxID=2126353 RepID=A0A2T3HQP1_9SPHI|nr:preprotein translocase subunit SecG [Pedobacter yulinensis]PST84775.1 preprotein translocase subunit SecG [Pedobacter yulinensis]